MRGWRPVVLSVLVIGIAYAADRVLTAAIVQYGTFPEAGNRAMVLAVDLVGSLLTVAGIAVLGSLIVRDHTARVAAVVVMGIGAYFGLAVTVTMLTGGAIELPLAFDAYTGGARFTRWAGTAVGILGLVALPFPARPAWRANDTFEAAWLPVAVIVVLLAVAYLVADPAVGAAFVGWSANREAVPYVVVDVLVRVVVVAALLGVGWLAANSHHLGPAAVMLSVGLAATVGLVVATGAMAAALAAAPLWISSSAVVLGGWQLLARRQSPPMRIGQAART